MAESDLIQVIINGLDSYYRPFIRSIQQCQDDLTYDELYGLLLYEEEDLKADSIIKESIPPTTFYTSQSVNRSGRSSFTPRGGRS